MAAKPTTLPRWSETGGGTQSNIIPAPLSGRQDVGFSPGEELPASWLNWLLNLLYRWSAYLRDGIFVGEAGQPGLTITGGSGAGGKGLVVTAGGTNENAIQATPTGAGVGVSVTTSGGGAGLGVTHSGSGRGLLILHSGSETAVESDASAGTGYALHGIPNTTKAPLRLSGLSAAPSSPVNGDIYYDTSTNKFRGYAGGAWVDLH